MNHIIHYRKNAIMMDITTYLGAINWSQLSPTEKQNTTETLRNKLLSMNPNDIGLTAHTQLADLLYQVELTRLREIHSKTNKDHQNLIGKALLFSLAINNC